MKFENYNLSELSHCLFDLDFGLFFRLAYLIKHRESDEKLFLKLHSFYFFYFTQESMYLEQMMDP